MPLPQAIEREFLKQIENQTRLSLVGPMFKGRYRARFPTIYVDKGADFADFPGASPALRIGDGDSASSAMDIPLPRVKDRSDLSFALQLIPKHITHVDLLGFLGGRRDHELIGFGEVSQFLSSRALTRVDFDQAITAFSAGSWTLDLNGTFSLVSFVENTVQMTGACEYPLSEPVRLNPVSSHGLSNVGHGTVAIVCTQPLFVFNS